MQNLITTEYQNQRILTTAQLAECYETSTDVISKNFNRNTERYQEGKHFYCLEGEALKGFLQSSICPMRNENKIRTLYLWTEKGALLHAKSLGTDKAWEVYDLLVETYFKVQQQIPKQMTQAEILAGLAQVNVEIEKKVVALDTKINNALDAFTTPAKDDWRHEMNEKINQMCIENGLNYQIFRHDMYVELENTARVDLTSRQSRLKSRMKKEGATTKECAAISKLDIIERDAQLKAIFEAIVRKYKAKYVARVAV